MSEWDPIVKQIKKDEPVDIHTLVKALRTYTTEVPDTVRNYIAGWLDGTLNTIERTRKLGKSPDVVEASNHAMMEKSQ